jgi:DNA-binding CsgD family transcriptional regulator
MASRARSALASDGPSRLTCFEFRSGEFWVLSADPSTARMSAALSRSEQDVLAHIVAGRSYAQIAAIRRCSRHTVAHHVSAILRKVGVASRRELVLAFECPPPPAPVLDGQRRSVRR